MVRTPAATASARTTVPVRVLVCDPHPLIRAGLHVTFPAGGAVEVVADSADAAGALREWRRAGADVALVALAARWSGHDGLRLVERLRTLDPGARAVVYSDRVAPGELRAAVDAGACGYIRSQVSPAELTGAIVAAGRGGCVYDPATASALVTDLTARRQAQEGLTVREVEVVRHMAAGLTNDAIAARMGVSPATVKTLAGRARRKLGASDRASAVAAALRQQLIA